MKTVLSFVGALSFASAKNYTAEYTSSESGREMMFMTNLLEVDDGTVAVDTWIEAQNVPLGNLKTSTKKHMD